MSVKIKKFGNDANNRIMVRLDTTKLEQLEAMLGKTYRAQVGVLGAKAEGRVKLTQENLGEVSKNKKVWIASESGMSNADIGLIHEKGSPLNNIPRRSFLEMPLTTRMPKVMSRVGAAILAGINEMNIELAYKKLARIAEGIVLQAFPTSGYGTWAPLGSGKLDRFGRHTKKETGPSRLIKSGQLRQSISSRVVTK
jgi:hypothetical protein